MDDEQMNASARADLARLRAEGPTPEEIAERDRALREAARADLERYKAEGYPGVSPHPYTERWTGAES